MSGRVLHELCSLDQTAEFLFRHRVMSALADREIKELLVLHGKAFEADNAKMHAALLPNLALRKFQTHRTEFISGADRSVDGIPPRTAESFHTFA